LCLQCVLQHEWGKRNWKIAMNYEGKLEAQSWDVEREWLQKLKWKRFVKNFVENNDKCKKNWSDKQEGNVQDFAIRNDFTIRVTIVIKVREEKRFEVGIGATFQFAKYIQESLWLVLEYLKKNIFSKKLGVLIRPGAKQKNWWWL